MGERKVNKDIQEEIKNLGLNQKQMSFVEYYLFITGLNAVEAVKLAGYIDEAKYDPNLSEAEVKAYKELNFKNQANRLLRNPAIKKAIVLIREDMNEMLIVDKLWVLNKLKTLAEKGSENVQLRATELLGKALSMFTEVTQVQSVEDPAAIARANFAERMAKEKDNVVEFKNGTNDE